MSDDRKVIVIGSGPAGAMAAHQLVNRGIPVTMLESGSVAQPGALFRAMGRNYFRRVPPMEHGTQHVASGDPKTDWYVNYAPGGLSNQWTGAVPRFCPEDFLEGERLHERYRWPVTYEEMAPWYEVCERLMDVTADGRDFPNLPAGYSAWKYRLPEDWQEVSRLAEKQGQGLCTLPLADGPPWMLVRRGTAFNSFTSIVRPLLKSPHFRLITGAHVVKLEWNGAKRQVEGIVYIDRADGSQHRLDAASVVLGAGPVNSTKILFASACPDFPDGIGNTDGLLGKFLHDHPKEWWVFDTERPISYLAPSGYLTRLPHATSEPLMANSWTIGVENTKDRIKSRFGLKGTAVSVQVFGTMIPEEQHFVRPSTAQNDEFGLPRMEIHIKFEPQVIAQMEAARGHMLCLMEEAGYRSTLRPVVPQLFPGVAVHYGGTTRMHSKREYGVLDRWNRVWDVPNVMVVDAAAFTTGAEKNPTPTLMALAARAADRLADDLKAK